MSVFDLVLYFDQSDEDPLCTLPEGAVEDPTSVLISSEAADHHGIDLDAQGFPTSESLEAWHRENNSGLFEE
ncbi:MAG: hypothetical protein HUU12_02465 [Anaerolineales bacterium]|nr:hypothetical protein [Anaerolineales bacterium]NUQ58231.1 hypothetical protein [Anaerolineales bacterium]